MQGAIAVLGIALLLVARWAQRRTHTSTDFFLAGRRLMPALAASSQFANAGLIWAVLVIPVQAHDLGAAAVWQAGALLLGYLLSWHFLAPRLQRLSIAQHSITLGQLVSADFSRRSHHVVLISLALVITCAVLLMTSARWMLAAGAVGSQFDHTSMLLVSGTAVASYLMLGGYWAASVVDAVFAVFSVLLLLVLAVFTNLSAEAPGALTQMWQSQGAFAGHGQIVALSFAVGLLSAGLGEGGQPQALNRFMAMPDPAGLRRARWLALLLIACAVVSALLIGWYARSLQGLEDDALWLQAVANRVLPDHMSAAAVTIIVAYLVLSVGSAWLAAVGGWLVDLRRQRSATATPLWLARWLVLLFAATAVVLALIPAGSGNAVERFQLGWQILAASVGPWLLARLSGKRIRATATVGAIWAGFLLTLIFHVMPQAAGDYLERVLPFVAALGIVLTGGERRRDVDRADAPSLDGDGSKA